MSNSLFLKNENIILDCYSSSSDNIEECNFYCPLLEGCMYRFATMPYHSTRITNDSKYESLNWLSENIPKYSVNPRNAGHKPIIWRPFSPSQDDKRTSNRNRVHSIKPSNVKIGSSKTSVFKAVKKSTFACTQCSASYTSNRQLNSHMRVHTGSKPFRCEYPNCFKSFARNEELTRHKRIHSGFKPYQCPTCKKRFGRKDHLSKHLKTHLQTAEKKVYECSFPGCGHRYTRSDALTRHKSTAHAIKSHK